MKEPVVAGCRSKSAAECSVKIPETETCFGPVGHPVRFTCLSALQWRILAWTNMCSSFLDCAVNSTPKGARVTAPPARTACGQGARGRPGARRRAPAAGDSSLLPNSCTVCRRQVRARALRQSVAVKGGHCSCVRTCMGAKASSYTLTANRLMSLVPPRPQAVHHCSHKYSGGGLQLVLDVLRVAHNPEQRQRAPCAPSQATQAAGCCSGTGWPAATGKTPAAECRPPCAREAATAARHRQLCPPPPAAC